MSKYKIKTNWDLSADFYKDLNDPQFSEDIITIKADVNNFVKTYKGKINTLEATDFLKYFELDDKTDYLINKVGSFLFYLASLDTQDQKVLAKQSEFDNLMIDLSNQTLFVSQEFKQIGYQKLIQLSKEPSLAAYSNFFVKQANSIKYVLDEKTEYALNLKSNSGSSAFENMYEEFTNSFSFEVTIDNKRQKLTSDQVRSLRMSSNESKRKKAFKSYHKVYSQKQNQIILGNCYSAIVKNWVSEVSLRGFDSVLSKRNIVQQIPDTAISTLLNEVEKAYPIYQKYLEIKAKLMGKKQLEDWNLLAPLEKVTKQINFEEGLELYLKQIRNFDEEFYQYSKSAFEQGRVDVFPKAGKRGGAFCVYDAQFPSFVLLNYTDKLNDVSTLAHEFGHSIHSYFSLKQKPQVYYSGTSMAETASIFNETLLNNYLAQTLTEKEKLAFLDNQLSDIFATIFRQIQYTLFEKKVHEFHLSGKSLTYIDYNRLWRQEQEKLTGDVVRYSNPAEAASGWSSIPHIFASPFYCYSYAFGNILSFALYEKYQEVGQDFVDSYKNILSSGGSKPPYELLLEYNLDITKAHFYQKGLKVVKDLVDSFARLAEK
ncbi:MAG: M3 family metallopeptidase [Patescibacteria group bacterium]